MLVRPLKMVARGSDRIPLRSGILAFVDGGQPRKLAEPTITSTEKRIPGLKLTPGRSLSCMPS
jgi:hypothetical protein